MASGQHIAPNSHNPFDGALTCEHAALQVPNYNEEVIYLTGRVATANQPTQLLVEVRFSKGAQSVKAFARSERPDVGQLLFDVLPSLLGA